MSGVVRQSTPPDLSLRIGSTPPPAPPPPPVVVPRRREPGYEPQLEAEETGPAFVPVVSRGAAVVEAGPAMPAVPPPALTPVTLWAAPVPSFTYLAGAAGSGKTFATKEWAEQAGSGLLLCATTGIAAINLGGETINSQLGFFDTSSLQEAYIGGFLTARLGKLWKCGIKRVVIDEVSMLSGDQLGFFVRAVEEVNTRDYILKTRSDDESDEPPQMGLTLVGDFLQLPPVKAPFAFESPEWDRFIPNVITLTDIRRQADTDFIEMLRAARSGNGLTVANYFLERELLQNESDDRFPGPTILAKNDAVDRYNHLRMQQLTGRVVAFRSTRWGKQRSEWGNPDKPPQTWGIPEELPLKIGALVMILSNRRTSYDEDGERRLSAPQLVYVNGDLGTLVDVGEEVAYRKAGGEAVRQRVAYVRLQRSDEIVAVFPVQRDVKQPADSARRTELRKAGREDLIDGKWELVGGITYMPLRVAYATTVHKSQGLSLDAVQVNVRDAFFKTPGMLYVALSRARSPEGLRLVGSRAALVERATCDPRLKDWR